MCSSYVSLQLVLKGCPSHIKIFRRNCLPSASKTNCSFNFTLLIKTMWSVWWNVSGKYDQVSLRSLASLALFYGNHAIALKQYRKTISLWYLAIITLAYSIGLLAHINYCTVFVVKAFSKALITSSFVMAFTQEMTRYDNFYTMLHCVCGHGPKISSVPGDLFCITVFIPLQEPTQRHEFMKMFSITICKCKNVEKLVSRTDGMFSSRKNIMKKTVELLYDIVFEQLICHHKFNVSITGTYSVSHHLSLYNNRIVLIFASKQHFRHVFSFFYSTQMQSAPGHTSRPLLRDSSKNLVTHATSIFHLHFALQTFCSLLLFLHSLLDASLSLSYMYTHTNANIRTQVTTNMQLFVRAENTHTLDVHEDQCVGDVRALVCELENLPLDEVCALIYFLCACGFFDLYSVYVIWVLCA